MSPRNLLFVDHAAALGGAEQSLLLLLNALDRDKWQAHLATTGGKLMAKALSQGINCHQLNLPRLRRNLYSFSSWHHNARLLATLASDVKAEVIYANTVRASLYSALAVRRAKRPFIWHMRDFWLSEEKPDRLWLDTAVKKIICFQATKVIANSHAVAAKLPCSGKIMVVHNGIDVPHFDPSLNGTPFRAENNIPDDVPLIGMVGRLRPWKGQATFLQMAAKLSKTWPDSHFVLVGGTTFGVQEDYPQQLQQMAQELQIIDRVIFTGTLTDVRLPLAAMDVFVHPGQPEPFGLVNVEAMAMTKPIVAFNHGALPEIVINGETGRLVDPGNVPALTEAISSILANPELGRQYGRNGRSRAETHFNIQQTAKAISDILEQVAIEQH